MQVAEPITITAEDRDLLYHRILIHLSGIDRVWLAARHSDFNEADRLGRQVCDELRLVLDDLGWGERRGEEPIELTTPVEAVRRVVGFLADQARAEDAAEGRERKAMQAEADENSEVKSMCNCLVEALGGPESREGSPDA